MKEVTAGCFADAHALCQLGGERILYLCGLRCHAMTSPPVTWVCCYCICLEPLCPFPVLKAEAKHCVSTGYQTGCVAACLMCELNKSLNLGDFLGKVSFLILEE